MVCFFNDLDTSCQHVWYIWGVFNDPSYDHYSLLQNVQNQTFRLLEDCDKSLLIHSLSAFDGCIYQQILRSKLLRDKLTPITAALGNYIYYIVCITPKGAHVTSNPRKLSQNMPEHITWIHLDVLFSIFFDSKTRGCTKNMTYKDLP